MSRLPHSSVLLRRAFLALGYFLFFGPSIVAGLLDAKQRIDRFFPDRLTASLALVAFLLLIAATSVVCFVTAWATKRNKPWARATGIVACVLMLPGFPWFTLLAAAGLYVLLTKPEALRDPAFKAATTKRTTDYWMAKKASKLQQVVVTVGLILALNVNGRLYTLSTRWGVPRWNPGVLAPLYFFSLLLLGTLVHELGHALTAWALYSRFKGISVGPFTWEYSRDGHSFSFEWKKLLHSGGFVASVPAIGERQRFNLIATVAGGPAASLLSGLLCLGLWAASPGSAWEALWGPLALYACLSLYQGIFALIPVGYCDGSMLYHLIRWDLPGRELLSTLKIAQLGEDAEDARNRGDFEKRTQVRQTALDLSLEQGERGAMVTAISYQGLGHAKLAQEDWPGAAAAFTEGLKFEAEIALVPALGVNLWSGLNIACVARHQVNAIQWTYAAAVESLEFRHRDPSKLGRAVLLLILGQVHQRMRYYEKGREALLEAARLLPTGRDSQLLRGAMLISLSGCELGLNLIDAGLATARHAANVFRSAIAPTRQNLAWDDLGDLGFQLGRFGQTDVAIEFLSEAIQGLENASLPVTAAKHRIKLAAIHRETGRMRDAWNSLPREVLFPTGVRRSLHAERALLHLAEDRPDLAVAEAEALLLLWQDEPGVERAIAQSLLATALGETGQSSRAATLASEAAVLLKLWKHPEVLNCPGALEPEEREAFLAADPLLTEAEKSRFRQKEATLLKYYATQA